MWKFTLMLLEIIIFVAFGIGIQGSRAQTQNWLSWSACGTNQKCDWQRNDNCSTETSPQNACQGREWREELTACDKCDHGKWLEDYAPGCTGETCLDWMKETTFKCSNSVRQPNCRRKVFEYCKPKEQCYGAWTNWVASGSCSKTCEAGVQFRYRTCVRNGKFSSNCDGSIPFISQNGVHFCNTQDCDAPEWGEWSACQCSSFHNQQRECVKNCEKLAYEKRTEYRNCPACSRPSTTTTTTTAKTTTTTTTTSTTQEPPAAAAPTVIITTDAQPINGRNNINVNAATTTVASGQRASNGQPLTPAAQSSWVDRAIIIATAAIIICVLVLIIGILVCRMRRKTKPLQIQVQPHSRDASAYNRVSILANPALAIPPPPPPNQRVYEEMRLVDPRPITQQRADSCPNIQRPLPPAPLLRGGSQPPKPPRRNRPLSQISVHSFPDFNADDALLPPVPPPLSPYANDSDVNVGTFPRSAPTSPSVTLRGDATTYAKTRNGQYLKPYN